MYIYICFHLLRAPVRSVNDPRVPKNIQPYQPPAGSSSKPAPSYNPMQVPGWVLTLKPCQ